MFLDHAAMAMFRRLTLSERDMYYMYIDMENQRKVGIILPIVENY
jgi:hypothetical protein